MTRRSVVAVAVLLLAAGTAEAALTTPKCLVSKRKAWSTRRKCEAAEDAKRLVAKATDFAKCRSKHAATLAKLDAKAAKAGIGCRYGNNGDGTVTDYDTGFMWERKIDDAILCLAGVDRCVSKLFTWTQALSTFIATLNSGGGFAGHTDWRIPTFDELFSIYDCSVDASDCIDPSFGPISVFPFYWTTTLRTDDPTLAAGVFFADDGGSASTGIGNTQYVRAVRSAL